MKKIALISTIITIFLNIVDINASNIVQLSYNEIKAPVGEDFKWYLNGEMIDGVYQREILIQQEGIYTVHFLNIEGELEELSYKVANVDGQKRKLIVIGDSTASEYDSGSYPRTGWGQVLQPFFNSDSVQVKDMAISGRSSKSFYNETAGWPNVMKELQEGDFLFIQFGHNDSKSDEERHTDPYTTYKEYLSIYIDTAFARGAYPVLLTSIHRNYWNGDQIKDSHGNYPPAMRQLATERNVPMIDLHQLTEQRWEVLGKDYVTNNIYNNLPEGLYKNYSTGNEDNTHLQEEGAWEVCKLVAKQIEAQKNDNYLSKIANHLLLTGMVKVLPNPGMSSTFKGGGVATVGSQVSLSARPASGYALSHWEIDGQEVSSDQPYVFIAGDSLLNLTGVCGEGFRISTSRDPLRGGKASGSGSFVDGTEVTLVAKPKEGFEFVNWTLNDIEVGTDTLLTVIVNGANEKYIAHFEEIVAVESQNKVGLVKLYPNPAKEMFGIYSSENIENIKIVDLSGKTVYNVSPFTKEISISVDKFQNGLYLVHIKTEGALFYQKLRILK